MVKFSSLKEIVIGILAASIGAVFPDADSDHSLINNKNPIFRTSNRVVNHYKQLLKKIFAIVFFGIPATFMAFYMYYYKNYSVVLMIFTFILIILSIKGAAVGEKIYIPIFTEGLRAINSGAARAKKIFMMIVYLSAGITCIYLSKGSVDGIIWGLIFIIIAIFPHRTFLHSPEGIILATIGVKYLEKRIMFANISTAFFIGYFSHLYLADIFTSSGVPISTIPLILRKTKLHSKFKRYKTYMIVYTILNKKLSIPLIKTGSKWGSVLEGIYVFVLFILLFSLIINNKGFT
jgi:hypothetical protein